VIHRDLKPDNIFLCSSIVKVLDFGISRIGGDDERASLTRTGTMLGTPAYMPLEQLRGSREVDERTDVYALGVILFEALSGRLPFDAKTPADQAVLLATRAPEHLGDLCPELRGIRAEAVMKALARKTTDRYPSVDVMRLALAQTSVPRSRLLATASIVIACAVLLAIAAIFGQRSTPARVSGEPALKISSAPNARDDHSEPSAISPVDLTPKGASEIVRSPAPRPVSERRAQQPLLPSPQPRPARVNADAPNERNPLQTQSVTPPLSSPKSLSIEQFRFEDGETTSRQAPPSEPANLQPPPKSVPSLNPSEF